MPKKFGKQTKSQSEATPILFTMGELDLIFRIDFKEYDLEKEESESKSNEKESNKESSTNYYKLEDINTLKDLSFIKDNEDLWDRIKLKSGNENIKLLLLGNKNANKRVKIEYICFGRPKFEGDEEFFEEIFDHVTDRNGLLINKTPLDEGGRFSLKIEMKYGKDIKTIQIGSTKEESKKEEELEKQKEKEKEKEKEGENTKNNEEENNEENQEEEEEEDEEDDYEENEAMQQKLIPKFKRSKSVLCNLEPSSTKYNMVYLNYEDFSKIPGNFKIGDMIELLTHFKKKNSTIFINFYKKEINPEIKEEDEKENQKTLKTEANNKKKSRNETEINKDDDEEKEDKKGAEKNEIKKDTKEKDKDNYEKKKAQRKKLIKDMKNLNKLYYITDIYFFDSEQAVKLFDTHYKIFTKDKESRKTITKSKLYDYFIKGIATGTEDEVHGDKAGLFLDEFNKFLIVRASRKSANKKEYDSQPYPKINHKNLKLVSDYKNIIKKNKDECYILFISSMVISMAGGAPKCLLPEVVYPSYLIGVELVKRRIECIKNKMNIPNEENFYKVKINLKALSKELEKFAEDDREGGFILDCTNKHKAAKKEYVSLYDYNLRSFFSNQKVRKNLKDKGFINSKGFIMYDPVYRSVMGAKKDHKKKLTDKEMKTKLMSNIKGIDVPSRIKDKEIDSKKLLLKQNIPTDKKIPFIKEPPKPGKKKITKAESSESSEGSSDEDSSNDKKNNSGSGSGSGDGSGSGGSGSGDGSGSGGSGSGDGSGDGSGSGSGSES